jgi:hypothetical protein
VNVRNEVVLASRPAVLPGFEADASCWVGLD